MSSSNVSATSNSFDKHNGLLGKLQMRDCHINEQNND